MGTLDDDDEQTRPEDQYIIEEVTPEVQEGYTTLAGVAVEEAEPYLPPTDPPVLASPDEGANVATGFGVSPEDAPFRAEARTEDAWIQEEVQRVLMEDAITANLPLGVRVAKGTVYLEGYVSDATDAEMAESVAGRVPGVVSVEDRTVVNPGITEHASVDFVTPDEQV